MAKKLGITFGGSGAEGIACLAYVRALEEAEIKPDIVSGTGTGGAVAAMYAAGMSYRQMYDFLKEIEFPGSRRALRIDKIKDYGLGILDDMGLEEFFKMVVPIKVFDRLYFPLRIVAADFATGTEIVFSEGDVSRAVRASVAAPGIFSPYENAGAVYIDGSCVNPVPFDIIRDECEVLAAIGPQPAVQTENENDLRVFPALLSAFNAAKRALSVEKQKTCAVDIYEYIALDGITTFDYYKYDDIIEFAKERAERFVMELKQFIE